MILAGSATNAALCVYKRNAQCPFTIVVLVNLHHLYCSRRAMAGTVATAYFVGENHATVSVKHSVTYLNRTFLFLINRSDGSSLAGIAAYVTIKAAPPIRITEIRLEKRFQIC